jgi:hypothetical protein
VIRQSLAFLLLAACGPGLDASDPPPRDRAIIEPNPTLAIQRPPLPELEMEALLRAARGRSKEGVLKLLGHPHEVHCSRDRREMWVYGWNERCTLYFRHGICEGYGRTE